MNPNVVVNGDVELNGDYEISGPVTIKRRLNTHDLLGSDGGKSLADLKNYGIKLNQEVIEGDFVFNQPLQVQFLQAHSIGNIPVDGLLRSGLKGGPDQVITGRKTFTAPLLTIEGAVDAIRVNRMDIEEFSKTVLTRTGNQNITGNIHFTQIDAFSLNANHVSLNGRYIRNFYGNDKDVKVPGEVYLKGTLKAKNKLMIGAFYPKNLVFNYNFTEIVQDTVFRYDTHVKLSGRKVFKDKLSIESLQTHGSLANLSQVPLDGVLRFQLDGDLDANDLNCGQVIVNMGINGLPAYKFGHSWLAVEGDQIFTEHQTFYNVHADKLLLYGHLEEEGVQYDVNSAMRNTYLTNRKEVILPKVSFGK